MSIHPQRDARLLGAGQIAVVSATRAAVACADARRVCMLDRTRRLLVVGDSGDLGSEARSVFVQGSLIWSVLSSGDVVSMSQADTPVLASRTAVGAVHTRWITGTGSVVVCSGASGEIVVLNAAGAVLTRWAGIGDIRVGVAVGAYLYLADHRGNAYILSINGTTGALAPVGVFSLPDCPDILSFRAVGSTLVLASKARGSVAVFSLAIPGAPVRTSLTDYQPNRILGVLDNAAASPLLDAAYTDANVEYWQSASGGCSLGGALNAICHAQSAQIDEAVTDGLVVQAATPTFSPGAGSYPATQSVTISSTTPLATIYYTTDGSTPTILSTLYTAPVSVAASKTLKAVAIAPGYSLSPVGTAVYIITSALVNSITFNASVDCMEVYNGILYVGGNFTSVTDSGGLKSRSHLASIDLSTGLVTSFFAGQTCDAQVLRVRFDSSGRLWVAGRFANIAGQARNYIARFTAALAADTVNFGLVTTSGGYVQSLDFDPATGRVFLAGNWDIASGPGLNHKSLLIFDSTDTLVSAGPNVTALNNGRTVVYSGGVIYVGGAKSTQGAVSYDGTTYALRTWAIQVTGVSVTVQTLIIAGGIAYIGGSFSAVQGTTRNSFAAVDLTTSATLQAWNPNANNEGFTPQGQASDANGIIYVSGFFSTLGGVSRQLAGAFDAAGNLKSWNQLLVGGSYAQVYVTGNTVFLCGIFANPAGGNNLYATSIF